jgi:hypothetical protein
MPRWENDHNVYIVGAGFSSYGGMPLVADFMDRMRDAIGWLHDQKRAREAQAIEEVLGFRNTAASAGYRVRINLDDIEELFSLASATGGELSEESVPLAIGGTLEFCRCTNTGETLVLDAFMDDESTHWLVDSFPIVEQARRPADRGSGLWQVYALTVYHFWAALMTGKLGIRNPDSRNTIISFNYDLLLDDALAKVRIPFDYGFRDTGTFNRSAREKFCPGGTPALKLLKLHGSVNWAAPATDGEPITIFSTYDEVVSAQRVPALLPPTWQKIFQRESLDVWNEAVRAIESATRIIVLGFSIPDTDVHFKYLLAAGLRSNISLRGVRFVNTDSDRLLPKVKRLLREELVERRIVVVEPSTRVDSFFANDNERRGIGRIIDEALYLPGPPLPRNRWLSN